jgi:hypothetical protein
MCQPQPGPTNRLSTVSYSIPNPKLSHNVGLDNTQPIIQSIISLSNTHPKINTVPIPPNPSCHLSRGYTSTSVIEPRTRTRTRNPTREGMSRDSHVLAPARSALPWGHEPMQGACSEIIFGEIAGLLFFCGFHVDGGVFSGGDVRSGEFCRVDVLFGIWMMVMILVWVCREMRCVPGLWGG